MQTEDPHPKLIVFDLDFTLWNCGGMGIDCCEYPFEQHHNGRIFGAKGSEFLLYPDIRSLLDTIDKMQIPMSLASRTSRPKWARQLMEMFDIQDRFIHAQIYPGNKIKHFRKIQKLSGISFKDMIFFDDEERNIDDVSTLGVQCEYVARGVHWQQFDRAMKAFRTR